MKKFGVKKNWVGPLALYLKTATIAKLLTCSKPVSSYNGKNSLSLMKSEETRCPVQFSSVQSPSCVRLFAAPWITACQAYLSITNSRSSGKLTSIKLVMPSSHLILGRPWTVTCQALLSKGILQARILEWVAYHFFRGSSRPRHQIYIHRKMKYIPIYRQMKTKTLLSKIYDTQQKQL